MYGWMVSNNLRSTLQLSAQWVRSLFTDLLPVNEVYLPDSTGRMAQCCVTCGTFSPSFRSLTKLGKVLLVPNDTVMTVNEMRYQNLDAVHLHRGMLRRAPLTLLGD